ncbi:MAG TPA: DNA-directed RNA polymerase subunit omega [Planctomycetota bacterium]|nr:DNA-directed RNA polymerase subunit omega [Planctomycetota bacterium]
MIHQHKFDELYRDVGGVYRTTVLVQKRLRELNRGARRLVTSEAKNPIAVVMDEIDQKKIDLVEDNDENREAIRAEVERLTMNQPRAAELDPTTDEEEAERRILNALNKIR